LDGMLIQLQREALDKAATRWKIKGRGRGRAVGVMGQRQGRGLIQ